MLLHPWRAVPLSHPPSFFVLLWQKMLFFQTKNILRNTGQLAHCHTIPCFFNYKKVVSHHFSVSMRHKHQKKDCQAFLLALLSWMYSVTCLKVQTESSLQPPCGTNIPQKSSSSTLFGANSWWKSSPDTPDNTWFLENKLQLCKCSISWAPGLGDAVWYLRVWGMM